MVDKLASSVVNRRFEQWSGQTKGYGMKLVFVASPPIPQHYELVQRFTIKIQLSTLVCYKVDVIIIILSNVTCSPYDMAEKLFTITHSLTHYNMLSIILNINHSNIIISDLYNLFLLIIKEYNYGLFLIVASLFDY